jgi:hypothetical protein
MTDSKIEHLKDTVNYLRISNVPDSSTTVSTLSTNTSNHLAERIMANYLVSQNDKW